MTDSRIWRFIAWMSLTLWLCISAPSLAQQTPVGFFLELNQSSPSVVETSNQNFLEAGRAAYQSGRFFEAKIHWEKAEQWAEQKGDRLAQAIALNNIALAHLQLGDYGAAEQILTQAQTQLEKLSPSTAQQRVLAQSFSTEGQLYRAQGQYQTALQKLRTAEKSYQRLNLKLPKNASAFLRNRLNQAELLRLSGLYPQAMESLNSAGQMLVSQTNTLIDPQNKALVLRQLGNLLYQFSGRNETGLCQSAQDCLEQSLTIAQQENFPIEAALSLISISSMAANSEDAQASLRQAMALSIPPEIELQAQINLIQQMIQQRTQQQLKPDTASQLRSGQAIASEITQAIALLETIPANRAKFRLQVTLIADALNLMKPRDGKNQYDIISEKTVERLIQQLLAESKSLQDGQFEAYALGYWGRLYEYRFLEALAPIEKQQQLAQAEAFTKQALERAEGLNLGFMTYPWLWQQGRLLRFKRSLLPIDQLEKRDQLLMEAIAAYESSVTQINLLKGDLITINRQNQLSFQNQIKPIYQGLIELLIEANHQKVSLEPSQYSILEHSKKKQTQKQLTGQTINLVQENFNSYLDRAIQIADSLQVAELTNFFRSDCLLASEIKIEDIDPKAAIIYPIIIKDRVEVVVGLPNTKVSRTKSNVSNKVNDLSNNTIWKHQSSSVNLVEFDQDLFSLRSLVSSRGTACQQAEFDDTNELSSTNCSRSDGEEILQVGLKQPQEARDETVLIGGQLYDILIRPFEADLEASGVETLLFLSSGSLQNIPMAVLYDQREEKYLIEKYAIATSPSLQLLDSRSLSRRNVKVILGGLTVDNGPFKALGFAKPEVESIQAQAPGSQVLLDGDFTQTNLETKVNELSFPVVHLATHGVFGSTLEDTYVVTADDRLNANELSALLQGKGLGSDQPIELLVLSACETAKGDELAGLGLAGIAVRSGARSTLGSLWFVDDRSTAFLMQRFYQELADSSVSRAEALRRAQLYVKDSDELDTSEPYFWAAFVLVGNWL